MSEPQPQSQEHPGIEATEASGEVNKAKTSGPLPSEPATDATEPSEALQATQQLPQAKPGRMSPFPRIPASARSISVVVVALFAIAGGIYLAFAESPATTSAASVSGQITTPGPMPGAPKTPVPASNPVSPRVVSVPGATVPTALQPTNPSQVKAWNSGAGGKALAQVTAQSGNALMANSGQEYAQMLLSCKALSSAVGSAQRAAPIQDAAMQKEYAAALSSLKSGAVNCISGIKQVPDGVEDTVVNVDHATLKVAVSDLSAGITALYAATEVLRQQ
jgi:hypothetical protein